MLNRHIFSRARYRRLAVAGVVVSALSAGLVASIAAPKSLEPVVYTIRFPEPASRSFTVDVSVPTGRRPVVELMMPIWSPGFYGVQNYADRVSNFSARATDGTLLEVTKPTPSRWSVTTGGRPLFT